MNMARSVNVGKVNYINSFISEAELKRRFQYQFNFPSPSMRRVEVSLSFIIYEYKYTEAEARDMLWRMNYSWMNEVDLTELQKEVLVVWNNRDNRLNCILNSLFPWMLFLLNLRVFKRATEVPFWLFESEFDAGFDCLNWNVAQSFHPGLSRTTFCRNFSSTTSHPID